MSDIFASYEHGLVELLNRLDKEQPSYTDFLTLQTRLLENISQTRRYGDTETRRAERAQILEALNEIALEANEVSFGKLCGLDGLDEKSLRTREILHREQLLDSVVREFRGVQNIEQRYVPVVLHRYEPPRYSFLFHRVVESLLPDDVPPHELLDGPERVLILGDAGIGKTTLLGWLALKTALKALQESANSQEDTGDLLPLYVSLQSYTTFGGQSPLERLICMMRGSLIHFHGLARIVEPTVVMALLRDLRFILLLDGLNDIPTHELDTFLEAVNEVMDMYPQNRYVLTSRGYRYGKIAKNLAVPALLELREMSLQNAQEFVDRYCAKLGIDGMRFGDLHARIRRLGQTPLYLRFILELHAEESTLAETPAGLIGGVMQKRLEWERMPFVEADKESGHLESVSDVIEWKALLGLAQLLQVSGGLAPCFDTEHPSASALHRIAEVVGDREQARQLVDNWCQKQILRLSNGHLKFWHPVFQTYLIATDMAQELRAESEKEGGIGEGQTLLEILSDDELHGALVMAIALVPPSVAVEVVKLVGEKDTVLAGVCLNNLSGADQIRAEFIQELYRTYRIVRIDYVGAPMQVAVQWLLPVLLFVPVALPSLGDFADKPISTMLESVSLPLVIGGTAAVATLLELTRVGYSRWINREFLTPIAYALASVRFPDALDTLDRLLEDSGQWFIVEGARHIFAQARVRSTESLEELDTALRHPAARAAAIAELVERSSKESLEMLLHLLTPSTAPTILGWVLQGLRHFAEQENHRAIIRPILTRFYLTNRKRITWRNRLEAYKTLRKVQEHGVPLPWPEVEEVVSRKRSSGFSFLETSKAVVQIFLWLVLIGIFFQLLNLILR